MRCLHLLKSDISVLWEKVIFHFETVWGWKIQHWLYKKDQASLNLIISLKKKPKGTTIGEIILTYVVQAKYFTDDLAI